MGSQCKNILTGDEDPDVGCAWVSARRTVATRASEGWCLNQGQAEFRARRFIGISVTLSAKVSGPMRDFPQYSGYPYVLTEALSFRDGMVEDAGASALSNPVCTRMGRSTRGLQIMARRIR